MTVNTTCLPSGDGAVIIGEAGSTERAQVTEVSPEFFTTLGAGPGFGRTFSEAETSYETNNVAILTDHTTVKGHDSKGARLDGEFNVFRVVIKKNGSWQATGVVMNADKTKK